MHNWMFLRAANQKRDDRSDTNVWICTTCQTTDFGQKTPPDDMDAACVAPGIRAQRKFVADQEDEVKPLLEDLHQLLHSDPDRQVDRIHRIRELMILLRLK